MRPFEPSIPPFRIPPFLFLAWITVFAAPATASAQEHLRSFCDLVIQGHDHIELVVRSTNAEFSLNDYGHSVTNSLYTQDRGRTQYFHAFGKNSITEQQEDITALDLGGGFGFAIRDLLKNTAQSKFPKAILVTLFNPATRTHQQLKEWEYQNAERLKVFSDSAFEDISPDELTSAFGKIHLINDLFGVMHYTTAPDVVLRKIHQILEVGGSAHIATHSLLNQEFNPSLFRDQVISERFTESEKKWLAYFLPKSTAETILRKHAQSKTNLIAWIQNNVRGFEISFYQAEPGSLKIMRLQKTEQEFSSPSLKFLRSNNDVAGFPHREFIQK